MQSESRGGVFGRAGVCVISADPPLLPSHPPSSENKLRDCFFVLRNLLFSAAAQLRGVNKSKKGRVTGQGELTGYARGWRQQDVRYFRCGAFRPLPAHCSRMAGGDFTVTSCHMAATLLTTHRSRKQAHICSPDPWLTCHFTMIQAAEKSVSSFSPSPLTTSVRTM